MFRGIVFVRSWEAFCCCCACFVRFREREEDVRVFLAIFRTEGVGPVWVDAAASARGRIVERERVWVRVVIGFGGERCFCFPLGECFCWPVMGFGCRCAGSRCEGKRSISCVVEVFASVKPASCRAPIPMAIRRVLLWDMEKSPLK